MQQAVSIERTKEELSSSSSSFHDHFSLLQQHFPLRIQLLLSNCIWVDKRCFKDFHGRGKKLCEE